MLGEIDAKNVLCKFWELVRLPAYGSKIVGSALCEITPALNTKTTKGLTRTRLTRTVP